MQDGLGSEEPPAAPPSPGSTRATFTRGGVGSTVVLHLVAVVSLVMLCYSNTLDAPFTFDDNPNIVENAAIKNLGDFLSPSGVAHVEQHVRLNRPLLRTRYVGYLSFALNYKVHGLEVRGYHLVNIAIHVVNALLVYWLVSLTLRAPLLAAAAGQPAVREDPSRRVALFTTLLFAVHPLQTQAVTYIVQRFASLAALFYLLALVLYATWRERVHQREGRRLPPAVFYVASLLSAVLAMRTKEFSVTLPAVMAVYELLFFGGGIARRLLFLTPFVLSTLLLPLAIADGGGALPVVAGFNEEGVKASLGAESPSRGDYLLTQFRVIVTYVRLLVLPIHQNVDHDSAIHRSFLQPAVLSSFLFHLALIAAGTHLWRSSVKATTRDRSVLKAISFGIFFFYLTLSAESGLVPILDPIAEHRVYLPSVGFFIALVAAAEAALRRWGPRSPFVHRAGVAALVAAVLALAVATYLRNNVWRDVVTLWEDSARGSPDKARPHFHLGLAYVSKDRIADAIEEFKVALRIKPDYIDVRYGLGYAYTRQGRNEEAINEYRALLERMPDLTPARNNLAMIYLSQGRYDEARREFEILLRLSPDGYPAARQFLEFLRRR